MEEIYVCEHNPNFKSATSDKVIVHDEISEIKGKNLKEIYVYETKGESLTETSERIDLAAKEVGVNLSTRKRRILMREMAREGKVSIFRGEPKLYKDVDGTNIRILSGTQSRLNAKKVEKRFASYDDVISDCIDKLDAIEKMVDKCAGDETDCGILYESLYELFNGEKR